MERVFYEIVTKDFGVKNQHFESRRLHHASDINKLFCMGFYHTKQ